MRKALAILAIVLLAGMLYEQYSRARDRKRPHTGRRVDIGGRSLNIICMGKGGPTVVLDAGGNEPGASWLRIQPRIASFARVCSWDRPGAGASDPGPYPRTSRAIAEDLHALLRAAGIWPPFVLAGASFGGHNVRVYNGLYPDEVAGMVLIDASHEEEYARVGPWGRGRRVKPRLRYPIYLTVKALALTGVLRLLNPRERPEATVAGLSTGMFSPENDRLAHESGGLGDKPLIVLTAGRAGGRPSGEAAAYQEVWKHELQPKLARLSTRGRQIIVENSTHGIADEAPDAVIGAIRQVVEEARATSP